MKKNANEAEICPFFFFSLSVLFYHVSLGCLFTFRSVNKRGRTSTLKRENQQNPQVELSTGLFYPLLILISFVFWFFSVYIYPAFMLFVCLSQWRWEREICNEIKLSFALSRDCFELLTISVRPGLKLAWRRALNMLAIEIKIVSSSPSHQDKGLNCRR